jgi:hypothetical protein
MTNTEVRTRGPERRRGTEEFFLLVEGDLSEWKRMGVGEWRMERRGENTPLNTRWVPG